MSDVKETAERISTERLAEIERRYAKAATIGDLVENASLPAIHANEIAAMATELLASRHADAQEGGEVLNHAQRAYDILVSGKPPFSERECRASYALTYINGINLSPSAAPSNPVVSDEMVTIPRDQVQSVVEALTETRAASIAGCESDGYSDPAKWADRLYRSHGGLTASIKTLTTALSVNPQSGSE